MENIENKAVLARLLAMENLHVEQRAVKTAMFDAKSRVLILPIFKQGLSADLMDLFVGHECGHALHTPFDGMVTGQERKINHTILNVCEDVRIERKMKNKYPGLRKAFLKAYDELQDMDFFQIKGKDINKLNFLDRLNLHAKIGAHLRIEFSPEELVLLNKVERAESYDDVLEVGQEIHKFLVKKLRDEKKNTSNEGRKVPRPRPDPDMDEEDDGEGQDNNLFDPDAEEEPPEQNVFSPPEDDGEFNEEKPDVIPNKESEGKPKAVGGAAPEPEPTDEELEKEIVSETADAFKENESTLFDTNKEKYSYANIPKLNLEKVVVDHKAIWPRFKKEMFDSYKNQYYYLNDSKKISDIYNEHETQINTNYNTFRVESDKVVSFLSKEFERMKNAQALAKVNIANTGDLNPIKLFSYKFSEDIFKRVTVMPGSKSHGLVMYIDWSGSMSGHIHSTVKQLLNLVMFCKKIGIPYDVYAFTSCYYPKEGRSHSSTVGYANDVPKAGDLYVDSFNLMNLLSSRMTSGEFQYAAAHLLDAGVKSIRIRATRFSWFSMGGTPLNNTIVAAMDMVPAFKAKYNLQVVNAVFLTDGEGHDLNGIFNHNGSSDAKSWTQQLVLTDPKTKLSLNMTKRIGVPESRFQNSRTQTANFIEHLKFRTGANVIGFFVLAARSFGNELYKMVEADNKSSKHDKIDELKKVFKETNCVALDNQGYTQYYLLRSENEDSLEDDELEIEENATVRGMTTAFVKHNMSKMYNRALLTNFIKIIS